ncbi:MAG: TRAP transporter large permease [Burkholderiales bacterium]|nr:TRAP transporter large permease [Burkholderiales bacterium]
MSGLAITVAGFVVLGVLIYGGMHIAVALLLTAFCGAWLIRGNIDAGLNLVGIAAADAVADYEYGVIPLFVLMGFLVMRAGVGADSYRVAQSALRGVPGALGHATVVGNAIFSAITGVSVAAVVLFTRMAVPEMLKAGYHPRFAVGVVAGSAMLGMLIPPSVLMIIYAILTETSIGDLFLAGIVPGLLLTAAFSGAILWLARRDPRRFGGGRPLSEADILSMREMLRLSGPIVLLIAVVLGGMYAGWFTATEAGAVGALAALLIALARRALDWKGFVSILIETGHVTASLVAIIMAANMFSRFLAIGGLPSALNGWIMSLAPSLYTVLAIYILVVLVLGTAMDSASTTLIAVPIFAVIFKAMGADLVWIGIITMITVEIGLITPPLGMAPFVIKMTLERDDISLSDIYAGALPFAVAAMAVVGLIVAFPWLATGIVR